MSNMEHVFMPVVILTAREDGRFDARIDWSESYQGSVDDTGRNLADQGEDGTEGGAAVAAMDRWTKAQPSRLVIEP